jgi:hypothetical protein
MGRLLEKAKREKKQMKRAASLGGLLMSCHSFHVEKKNDHISGHR